MIYHVAEIVTGRCVYSGSSLSKAAEFLAPGTTYGSSEQGEEAKAQATRRRTLHLAAGYTRPAPEATTPEGA